MILSLLFSFLLTVSCSDKEETIGYDNRYIRDLPGEYEVDHPSDLVLYFDSLRAHNRIRWHADYESCFAVLNSIRDLDSYIKGHLKLFPAKELMDAAKTMAFENAYINGHGIDSEEDICDVFLFRFLEQVALHSPKIDFITTFHQAGNDVGLLYFASWNGYEPLYSFLVYKSNDGYRLKTIGHIGETKIEKVFPLKDEKGRQYYLCSFYDIDDLYYSAFEQYLYGYEGGEAVLLASFDRSRDGWFKERDRHKEFIPYGSAPYEGSKIIFNPKELRWNLCTSDGNFYHAIKGTRTIYLKLDWDNSSFYAE